MEENRKGPGIFYAVVGVATLVVAIIGATFAYFSASAEVTYDENGITGTTESLQGALTVKVSKVSLGTLEERQVASDNLIPSNIAGISAENISAVLTAKCANNGYSACHVYKIEAESSTTVTAVDLRLATLSVDATDEASWKYVVYEGTDTTATDVTVSSTGFDKLPVDGQVIRTAGLTADTPVTYYLMVYIANDANAAQDAGDTKDVTGTYTGTVSMTAAGGAEVSATFSSQA